MPTRATHLPVCVRGAHSNPNHAVYFDYGYGSIFAPRDVRQAHLCDLFGFECGCAKCLLTGEELAASEARIARIGSDVDIMEALLAWASLKELIATDASTVLARLEERYALVAAEWHDGLRHGAEWILQAFVEFCDNSAALLTDALTKGGSGGTISFGEPAPASSASPNKRVVACVPAALVRAKAMAYSEAARRWARAARETARIFCGDDSPSFNVYTSVLKSTSGAGGQPATVPLLDFCHQWVAAGLATTLLSAYRVGLQACYQM